jgi:cytochrome oxidase assembly protein ShyY1
VPFRLGQLRFLLSRRWVLLLVSVLLLAYACLLLGRWQWHRLEGKKAANAIIRTNQKSAPKPVDQVLRHDVDPPDTDQYAVVSATGTYEASKTVIVRYQTHNGSPGVDVVVPLVTSSGTALLVDRGWFQTSNQGVSDPSQVPAPPSGRVTVTGWVRQNASGGAASVIDASTRAISSSQIEPAIGIPTYGGFVQLLSESPRPATALARADAPDLSNGPHFFYALQWWFFGILALFGYGYLAWEEVTGRGELRRSQQPTRRARPLTLEPQVLESPGDPAVDRQHHAGDEGRGRTQHERRGAAEL